MKSFLGNTTIYLFLISNSGYDKLTCGIHRYKVIEILYINEVLSNRILKEMEFDSYAPIRKFYKKIK